jgi:dTDP-4-dehydrorhamnose reductase
VLVTGANGLVGSRVVARLAQAGQPVIASARGARREAIADLSGVEYVETDLAHAGSLRDAIERSGPGAIVHCGARTDVDACEADPPQAWAVNVSATAEAALAARTVGARLVALSTDYVFDGEAGRSYVEEDRPNPRGAYARTKRAGEEAALGAARDVAVCRVAVVYSGRKGAKTTFAVTAADSLRAGKQVKAFTDQVVSPTLADNAAEMVIGVHRSGAQGLFHCAGATEVSRLDFCRALARKLGADEALIVPVQLADLQLPAPRPLKCGLRVDKLKQLLGESVPLPLEDALDRFLEERRG